MQGNKCSQAGALLQMYKESLFVKEQSIFDLMNGISFTLADFTFFPQLAKYIQMRANKKADVKIGFYSALIFLSTKIHYQILADAQEHAVYRAGVQFPILLGDMLYGKAVEEIMQNHPNLLRDYLQYLSEFHQIVTDYLNQKKTLQEVNQVRYGVLAQLTCHFIGVDDETIEKESYDLAMAIFHQTDFEDSEKESIALEQISQNEFYQKALQDRAQPITTFDELKIYIQGC